MVDLGEGIERSKADTLKMREEVETLGQEVSSANSTLSTLKDNIRLRKLKKDIAVTEAEMAALDLEEASKARQQFDEKYTRAKAAEEDTTRKVPNYFHDDLRLSNRVDYSLNILPVNWLPSAPNSEVSN